MRLRITRSQAGEGTGKHYRLAGKLVGNTLLEASRRLESRRFSILHIPRKMRSSWQRFVVVVFVAALLAACGRSAAPTEVPSPVAMPVPTETPTP